MGQNVRVPQQTVTDRRALPSPYVELDRAAWSRLRENHPLGLTAKDVSRLQGLGDRLDLQEVEEVSQALEPAHVRGGQAQRMVLAQPGPRRAVELDVRRRECAAIGGGLL